MGTFQNRKKQPLTLLRADLLPYGPHMAQQGLLNRINKVPKLKECNLKTKQIKNRVLCCSFTLHLQLQNVTAFKFSKYIQAYTWIASHCYLLHIQIPNRLYRTVGVNLLFCNNNNVKDYYFVTTVTTDSSA